MIRFTLYQNTNSLNETAFGKWYPRPVVDETFDLDGLSKHMASHNSPFSEGVIKGMMTDMVSCIKELLLDGKSVKIDDLAIFSVGIRSNGGAENEKDFSVSKHIAGIKLRARATGELSTGKLNLEAVFKKATSIAGSTSGEEPDPDNQPGTDLPDGGGIEGI